MIYAQTDGRTMSGRARNGKMDGRGGDVDAEPVAMAIPKG